MEQRTPGRTVLTGASGTLGRPLAEQLLARGEELVLGVRSVEQGWALRRQLLASRPEGEVHVLPLDLASLASVREFAAAVTERFESWDRLINNAAVITLRLRTLTEDRFEAQLGVNHLGHFALTGLLMPIAAAQARVVTVSSLAARWGTIRFHDLRWDHGYRPMRGYAASKLANLLFARELDRRLLAAGEGARSFAAHPGVVELAAGPAIQRAALRTIGQPPEAAARVLLAAAFEHPPEGDAWMAPAERLQTVGPPAWSSLPRLDDELRTTQRLWRLSGQLTRVPW